MAKYQFFLIGALLLSDASTAGEVIDIWGQSSYHEIQIKSLDHLEAAREAVTEMTKAEAKTSAEKLCEQRGGRRAFVLGRFLKASEFEGPILASFLHGNDVNWSHFCGYSANDLHNIKYGCDTRYRLACNLPEAPQVSDRPTKEVQSIQDSEDILEISHLIGFGS